MLTTLTISGMRSVHCTRALFTAFAAVEGITSADVQIGCAVIDHDGRASVEALRAAVEVAGFEVIEAHEERRRLPTW